MKMVKSLLLGSAAGLVAVAGAQAADLPVKAKAADPVRICSLYGKGFYYIPGSDMCLSITGFTRFQIYAYQGGVAAGPSAFAPGGQANGYSVWNNTSGPFSGGNGLNVRAGGQNDLTYRTRVMVTFDARQQTAYGTLRSVVTAGFTNDIVAAGTAGTGIYANRGFIQIAGFTMGKAVSFYDFYAAPAYTYYGVMSSDTGDGGQVVMGYTAQFGGGISATISAEEPRRNSILNTQVAATAGTLGFGTNDSVQYRIPDVVGAVRWDQAWGAVQVMGALHDASSGYYGASAAGQLNSGHPSDTWGWAAGVGLKLNIGADVLDTQFNYTQGATKYLSTGVTAGGTYYRSNGANSTVAGEVGFGTVADGVYGLTSGAGGVLTGINLTTAWGVNAAYDHRWSPALKTSVYGGYASYKYNAQATSLMCNTANGLAISPASGAACNMDWQQWFIGSRTQWDVARSFYVGVDVLYNKLQSANRGATVTSLAPGIPRVTGTYNVADQEAWVFTFRAHRDIVP